MESFKAVLTVAPREIFAISYQRPVELTHVSRSPNSVILGPRNILGLVPGTGDDNMRGGEDNGHMKGPVVSLVVSSLFGAIRKLGPDKQKK